jgi:hypothetical protein
MRFSSSILAALVVLLTMAGAHAVLDIESARTDAVPADIANNPAPAGENTHYCGYLYKAQGVRGDVVELPAEDGGFYHTDGGQSAIVSAGCSCAFFM